jgi:hypothetical protein
MIPEMASAVVMAGIIALPLRIRQDSARFFLVKLETAWLVLR